MYQSCLSKSPIRTSMLEKQISLPAHSLQFHLDKPTLISSQIHENHSLDMSSESECAPEPPPRPTSNIVQTKPPPLPPKKQPGEICSKPPPRPPYGDDSHYDYMDNYETGPNSIDLIRKSDKSPSIPAPARKAKFETAFMSAPQRPKKQFNVHDSWSSEEDYLTPISFPQKDVSHTSETIILPPPQRNISKTTQEKVTVASYLENKPSIEPKSEKVNSNPLEGLDITLSQLTISGLNELAVKLNISPSQLSNMTLVQLTEFVSNFIKNKSGDISSNTAEFKADFANFNNFNEEPHDKYAVFRELLQEEIKQTKIDTEPEEHLEERKKEEEKLNNLDITVDNKTDRYAALREIADNEINQTIVEESNNKEDETADIDEDVKLKNKTNIIDTEEKLLFKDTEDIIEYTTNLKESISPTPLKSPAKIKSPVITEMIQSSTRPTSGSLSDIVSGSSPEMENMGSSTEVEKKLVDAIGESWAVFDQPSLSENIVPDKHSEEGVSPWSSDSKEFGNGSPPEWKPSSRWEHHRRDQEGWWDTSAEPEEYYPQNRRSTDSYEEEIYDYYERPSRRSRHPISSWSKHSSGGGTLGASAAGGHSSSSRDASPWEEEPRRRSHKENWSRHPRQHSFERQRRHADSWDEEDDYEYHWPERHVREGDKERHRDQERWVDDWGDSRRHRRRRDVEYDHWCCPDWEQEAPEQPPPGRYSTGRWRKHEDRYYSRESQDSPWEDDYNKEPEPQHGRYLSATMKRNWKRPSSASEMERKSGEIKSRQGQYYMTTGGSDGERDRRYKAGRRSRSRDSQFTETIPHSRHKNEVNQQPRTSYRMKQHSHQKEVEPKKLDSGKLDSLKKSSTLGNRKKTKESPKTEEPAHSFSRKFENNFIPSETESPVSTGLSPRFTFENEFETSEAESPIVSKPVKGLRFDDEQKPLTKTKKTTFKEDTHISPSSRTSEKSPFEDDFSPPVDRCEQISASSIKEETDELDEEDDSLSANSFNKSLMRKKILCSKPRNNLHIDTNLRKSESVNIFARENDPFDDEFFCENTNSDSKWTESFQKFDFDNSK